MNVPGASVVAISPPASAAEPDAEVHHHALHCERRVPPVGGVRPGDQLDWLGPEAAVPDARDGRDEKPCHASWTNG